MPCVLCVFRARAIPSVFLIFEQEALRCSFVAPFCHIYNCAIDRVKVGDFAGTVPTKFSIYKAWIACDFADSDEAAKIVKTVVAEEHAEGVTVRVLPYAVTSTARDSRRRKGRGAAFYQYAAAHIGGHALEGCDNHTRRRRASNDCDLIEPGAF